MHLFIDTTDKMTFGLLSSDFKWIEFFFDPKIIISSKLHLLVQKMLEKNKLEFSQLESLIYIAGPGSYTGMRVAEGFAQIVEWQKMKVYSLYHYEIPKICGYDSGVWFASAFKGEYFLYNWSGDTSSNKLVLESDLQDELKDKELFSQRENSEYGSLSTSDLLEQKPQTILKNIFENKVRRELYYYRPLEQEFKKC